MIVEKYLHMSLVKQKQSHNFLNQSEVKLKPIASRWLAGTRFPALDAKLHVLTSSSDWFIVLFVFIVIGRSNNFGFLVLRQSIEKHSRVADG